MALLRPKMEINVRVPGVDFGVIGGLVLESATGIEGAELSVVLVFASSAMVCS